MGKTCIGGLLDARNMQGAPRCAQGRSSRLLLGMLWAAHGAESPTKPEVTSEIPYECASGLWHSATLHGV